jgi:hypothetical protein
MGATSRNLVFGVREEGAGVAFRGAFGASGEIEMGVTAQPTTGPVEARDLRCDLPRARERRA